MADFRVPALEPDTDQLNDKHIPSRLSNSSIASLIANDIATGGTGIRTALDARFPPIYGQRNDQLLSSTPPSVSPLGFSLGTGLSRDGWPADGTVITSKRSTTRVTQWLTEAEKTATAKPVAYFRNGYTVAGGVDAWGPFQRIGSPRDYNSGDASELVTTLPVPLSTTDGDMRVIYSIELPDLQIGELLMTSSEFQVTNDLGYNVMVMAQIILGETAMTVKGTEITEANGRNVTPAAHHDSFPKVGSHRVTRSDRKFVNVVAWSAATNSQPGHTIQVDPDYGRLSVVRM